MATAFQVVFDAANPDRSARFWAEALHYQIQPPPEGYASWEDFLKAIGMPEDEWDRASAIVDPDGKQPRIFFQKVPEGKVAKNRVHLDINISQTREVGEEEGRRRVDAEVERLKGLGASEQHRATEHGEYWVVMQDVEGNEFCVQ
jgi:hypothetical protein